MYEVEIDLHKTADYEGGTRIICLFIIAISVDLSIGQKAGSIFEFLQIFHIICSMGVSRRRIVPLHIFQKYMFQL
jgi:hypothetical protein